MSAKKNDLFHRLCHVLSIVIPVVARLFSVFVRFFSGAILCAFAVAPGWVAFGILSQALANPSEFDLKALVACAVCFALLYFLLLLAYRAFSNTGRKEDGGLLPPWTMRVFVASFGVLAILTIIFGIYSRKWTPVIGGFAYLGTALSVQATLKIRRKRGRFVA
jgi:hypothetical protein